MNKKRQAGFTIMEVLIASMIFTIVLLLCTQAVLRIGQLYYKGVAAAQIQELTRQLATDIGNQVQFGVHQPTAINASSLNGGSQAVFSAGDQCYRITMNRELGTDTSTVLQRKPQDNPPPCPTNADFWANAQELGIRRMRILGFSIQPNDINSSLWMVNIRLGLGSSDMYVNMNDTPAVYNVANCKSGSGYQFCATTEHTATLLRRVD